MNDSNVKKKKLVHGSVPSITSKNSSVRLQKSSFCRLPMNLYKILEQGF